jgi:riboflavin kinase/FMN adenylyltransferase
MRYSTTIIKGKKRGRDIGFPTLNLKIPKNFLLKHGIYACWIWINKNKYKGALHYGPIPTFKESQESLEVFVLDYQEQAVIRTLDFQIVKYLRSIKKYENIKDLTRQIEKDVIQVKKISM